MGAIPGSTGRAQATAEGECSVDDAPASYRTVRDRYPRWFEIFISAIRRKWRYRHQRALLTIWVGILVVGGEHFARLEGVGSGINEMGWRGVVEASSFDSSVASRSVDHPFVCIPLTVTPIPQSWSLSRLLRVSPCSSRPPPLCLPRVWSQDRLLYQQSAQTTAASLQAAHASAVPQTVSRCSPVNHLNHKANS